jgi:hypothetical protein
MVVFLKICIRKAEEWMGLENSFENLWENINFDYLRFYSS